MHKNISKMEFMDPLDTHKCIPSSVLSTVPFLIGILQVSVLFGHPSPAPPRPRLSIAGKHQQTVTEIVSWNFPWGTRLSGWGQCGLFKASSAPVRLM